MHFKAFKKTKVFSHAQTYSTPVVSPGWTASKLPWLSSQGVRQGLQPPVALLSLFPHRAGRTEQTISVSLQPLSPKICSSFPFPLCGEGNQGGQGADLMSVSTLLSSVPPFSRITPHWKQETGCGKVCLDWGLENRNPSCSRGEQGFQCSGSGEEV